MKGLLLVIALVPAISLLVDGVFAYDGYIWDPDSGEVKGYIYRLGPNTKYIWDPDKGEVRGYIYERPMLEMDEIHPSRKYFNEFTPKSHWLNKQQPIFNPPLGKESPLWPIFNGK